MTSDGASRFPCHLVRAPRASAWWPFLARIRGEENHVCSSQHPPVMPESTKTSHLPRDLGGNFRKATCAIFAVSWSRFWGIRPGFLIFLLTVLLQTTVLDLASVSSNTTTPCISTQTLGIDPGIVLLVKVVPMVLGLATSWGFKALPDCPCVIPEPPW